MLRGAAYFTAWDLSGMPLALPPARGPEGHERASAGQCQCGANAREPL